MRVLITGATGFVGRAVTRQLVADGHQLCLLVRSKEKFEKVLGDISDKVNSVITILDDDWAERVVDFNPETTIHLAAAFTGGDNETVIHNLIGSNVEFPTRLISTLSHTDCKTFISTGTFTEFPNGDGEYHPLNLYSATKTALRPILDYFCSVYKIKWVSVVVYSPYGRKNESKKVIDYLVDAVGAEEPVAFSDGKQILDFIHVDDMAGFYSSLIEKIDTVPDRTQFHLGTGRGYSIREVADIMTSVFGHKVNADWGKRPRNPYDVTFAVAPQANNIRYLDWHAEISMRKGLEILKEESNK